jgi:hypothetical protein
MSPMKKMSGKRVQFDEETWAAIEAVMRDSDSTFQELTDEAFATLLKKYRQPVGLMDRSKRAWASVKGDEQKRMAAKSMLKLIGILLVPIALAACEVGHFKVPMTLGPSGSAPASCAGNGAHSGDCRETH